MKNKFDVYVETYQMLTVGYFWVMELGVIYLLFAWLYFFFAAISLHFLIAGKKELLFPLLFFNFGKF